MEAAGPSRKRRKGGIRQREAAATQEVTKESVLYTLLMSYLPKESSVGPIAMQLPKLPKQTLMLQLKAFIFQFSTVWQTCSMAKTYNRQSSMR